jgi:hypothetical protein
MDFSSASIEKSTSLLEGASAPSFSLSHGINNDDLPKAERKVLSGASYRDLSTVIAIPSPTEFIHHRVEGALSALMRPMNQRTAGPFRLACKQPLSLIQAEGFEVADAYNSVLREIEKSPDMSKWKFFLTVEHDNLPPPDGLIALQRAMYDNAELDAKGRLLYDEKGLPMFHFLGIGGLYWVKGEGGAPMIYGNPKEPRNFNPQPPVPGALQECHGIAMGFSIFSLQHLLLDKRLRDPWFESRSSWDPARGISAGTQDLIFCGKARDLGYRFAVDNRVKVGHLDFATGMVW